MCTINNEPNLKDDLTSSYRDGFIRRARWMKLLIDELKETCDDWEVRARRAISKYGTENGLRFKADMKNPGVGEVCNYVGAGAGRQIFEVDVLEQNEQNFNLNFHHCPLVTGWQMEGCSDEEIRLLCDIAMDGDRACAKAMGVTFDLVAKIADGDPYCGLRFSQTENAEHGK